MPLINSAPVSIYLLLDLYLSSLIIHAFRLCCECSRTEGSFYVWFRFNPLRLTYTPQMADNWCLSSWLSITTPANSISLGASPIILQYYVFCRESVLMVIIRRPPPSSLVRWTFARHHLRLCFANQGWDSIVGCLVMIIVLAWYKNVMEVVKRRKLMEANMTFWRQHSGKLDSLSFPPSLANCCWPLPGCNVCYPLWPSHITWVNSVPILYPSHPPTIVFQSVIWW